MYTTLVLLAYFALLAYRPELAPSLAGTVWFFGILLIIFRVAEIGAFKSVSEQHETDDDENDS